MPNKSNGAMFWDLDIVRVCQHQLRFLFNMAAVRHIGFSVTSSYCILEHYFMLLPLC